MITLIRWIVGLVCFAAAARWGWLAWRAGAGVDTHGHDPETGLTLRTAPLTGADLAAALERERAAELVG